ncbi:AbrB/MazE/SpoVT family DNA-binding domain-containing protein [Candidatus Woesearchaeota archaeon]|nr:AbrB/MazE/SpoVT family DNA-binding domain-containing protein [Candidatus Woesearchaeota archaeon]
MNNQKMRTVNVNDRGQLVIPEDIRKDLGIEGTTTLVLIKKEGEILLKKEAEVLETLDENRFWKAASHKAMESAWGKEDKIWEKFFKKGKEA